MAYRNFVKKYLKEIQYVDSKKFSLVTNKMRQYCLGLGYQEAYVQNRFDLMSQCDDPKNLQSFTAFGDVWGLPQTGQMALEDEILSKPDAPGYFSQTTSYRMEPNPVEGRHMFAFPMFEVEHHGGYDELHKFQTGMLKHLGYDVDSKGQFSHGDYEKLAKEFGVEDLENKHEAELGKDNPVYFIDNFPTRHTYWNMKRNNANPGHSFKTDVIVGGAETIGSAERSCDVNEMHDEFFKTADGEYSETLMNKFGEDRVKFALDKYLSHTFIPRSGMGIGICRLIDDMDKRGMIDELEKEFKQNMNQ